MSRFLCQLQVFIITFCLAFVGSKPAAFTEAHRVRAIVLCSATSDAVTGKVKHLSLSLSLFLSSSHSSVQNQSPRNAMARVNDLV